MYGNNKIPYSTTSNMIPPKITEQLPTILDLARMCLQELAREFIMVSSNYLDPTDGSYQWKI